MTTVIILGSGPSAVQSRALPKSDFDALVAINNAWQVRPDWDYLICPDDFPEDRKPETLDGPQAVVGSAEFVPATNAFGGFVFAGGTMAFTAGYWALAALKPERMIFWGCDMVYPSSGNTHFYGSGTPDPLRVDPTLRSLEAKSARLMYFAAKQGCTCLRAPEGESRLVFPVQSRLAQMQDTQSWADHPAFAEAQEAERALGYFVETGRYWEQADRFDLSELDHVDRLWLEAVRVALPEVRNAVA